jgi:stage III sporulation protein AH
MKVKVFSKRALTIIGLVVLLVITGIINIALTNDKPDTPAPTTEVSVDNQDNGDYDNITVTNSAAQTITQYEVQRKIDRQKELQYLNEIIADDTADSKTVSTANDEKLLLISAMDNENVIAEILVAKGFKDIAVVCGKDSVNVMVKKKDITDAKIAQILDVVLRETSVKSDRIKIIPVE